MSRAGAALVLAFALMALAGAWVAPYDPRTEVDTSLQPPSCVHWLGTDDVGRDILSEVIVGSRISIAVGLTAGLAATLLGAGVGLAAGYLGGWSGVLLMRLVDVFLVMPKLPLLVLLTAYLGGGFWTISGAFLLLSWAYPARLIRSQVLIEKHRPYVIAARLSGAGWVHAVRKHILPALAPLIAAVMVEEMSHAVMAEAGLSFLGLGDPTWTSWGSILHYAFVYPALFLNNAWVWWALPPGICLTLLLAGLALIGISLEQSFDPRLKEGGGVES